MREWQGIRDDLSPAGNDQGMTTVIGASFYVTNELGRRSGLTAITASGGAALGSFRSAVTGSWLLIVTAAGTIEGIAL